MSDWAEQQQREAKWLKSLGVGSEVAVYHSGSFYGRFEFTTIAGETAKYWRVGNTRYRKENGHEAGNHYSSHLVEPTPELKAAEAAKKRRLILERKIESVRWRDLSIEALEAVN